MAINFSASFAACLAAGLKVPRQIMYCISQDTGAPYVLYKDSQEAAERGALGTAGQWGTDMYPSMQQSPQAHLTNHHSAPQLPPPQQQQQQTHPSSSSPRADQQQQRQNEQNHGGNLPSPATSPYPTQQSNANQDMDEDVTSINQVSISQALVVLWYHI